MNRIIMMQALFFLQQHKRPGFSGAGALNCTALGRYRIFCLIICPLPPSPSSPSPPSPPPLHPSRSAPPQFCMTRRLSCTVLPKPTRFPRVLALPGRGATGLHLRFCHTRNGCPPDAASVPPPKYVPAAASAAGAGDEDAAAPLFGALTATSPAG